MDAGVNEPRAEETKNWPLSSLCRSLPFDVDSAHTLCMPFIYDFCVGPADATFVVVRPGV